MQNVKKSPHDELFKKIFKNRENARDLLSVVLPQNIIARMDDSVDLIKECLHCRNNDITI